MVTSLFVSFNFLVSRYFVSLHFYEHNSISTAFAASSVFHLMKPFEILAIIVLSSAVLMPSVPFFVVLWLFPFLRSWYYRYSSCIVFPRSKCQIEGDAGAPRRTETE